MSPIRSALMAPLAALAFSPSPAAAQARAPGPPPIPAVSGPLALRIVYPLPDQRITAVDSTFLFGSTGTGAARLFINGLEIPVAPNGAFLAWVPIPRDSATAVFRLLATSGADTAQGLLRVQLPRSAVRPDTGSWVDPATRSLTGIVWAEPDELLRFSFVGAPNHVARLGFPRDSGRRWYPMLAEMAPATAIGPFNRDAPRPEPRETRYTVLVPAALAESDSAAPNHGSVLFTDARDSARGNLLAFGHRLTLIDPARRPVVLLDDDTARTGLTDGAVAGTPEPNGTYHWFFRNGTPAAVSGRRGNQIRLRLSGTSHAWVSVNDIAAWLPAGTPEPHAALRLVRLRSDSQAVTARIALTGRVPFRLDEDGSRLTLRLYSARADADWLQYGSADPFVTRMAWEQPAPDEVTVAFDLARPVFGWRTRWEGSDLILEIRRPPRINAAAPLRGRVIAIDPGHPPIGATGPTGLREAEANLSVARELRGMLERAGARVFMMRDADTNVGIYERTNLAERVNADVLVSIHNNAFPDGVNPWENNGTSAYYYMPRSARLARLVQQGMVRRMGLRDLGFGRGDLALVRVTWMPSVLTEGAFMMIPEQEHGLRTPAFQRAYARGVMDGLAAYFRELAR